MNDPLAEAILKIIDEDVEHIKNVVSTLKVNDKTNFGVVTKITDKSIEFKAKDLGKSDILFNQRKLGSRDYVLDKLVKVS